jgi:hypothetical protein
MELSWLVCNKYVNEEKIKRVKNLILGEIYIKGRRRINLKALI